MQKGDRQLDRSGLFGRVVSILETSRANVVRSVNSEMVAAYWLIGREIVEELQKGEGHAGYGETVIDNLSIQLNKRFGKGFSITNLRYFRAFYLAFKDRSVGGSNEFATQRVANSIGFMPSLGWSHYRALMRVRHPAARTYYEREAASNDWSVRQLELQKRLTLDGDHFCLDLIFYPMSHLQNLDKTRGGVVCASIPMEHASFGWNMLRRKRAPDDNSTVGNEEVLHEE